MTLSVDDLTALADLAISAAAQAGRFVARSRPQQIDHKSGGDSLASQVVTEIDRRSEEIILEVLAPSLDRFQLGMLTEERDDDGGRLTADHFWCIDPLDGTLPFIEGSPGSAVSIALVDRDGVPLIGVIHDPVEASLLHATRGGGAFRDGRRWSAAPRQSASVLSVFADRSFLTKGHHDVLAEPLDEIAHGMGLRGVELHVGRGAVMNAWGVLEHPPGCYFKLPGPTGGGSVWDFAATACVFGEVGAVASDMHGGDLDLNRTDSTFMNHRGILFATDETVAQRVRALAAAP